MAAADATKISKGSRALTIDDLRAAVPDLHDVELLGKKCFIRELNFDAQMKIATIETESEQLKTMIALSLCDEAGELLFKSEGEASEVLGKLPGSETLGIFDKVKEINNLDDVEEKS